MSVDKETMSRWIAGVTCNLGSEQGDWVVVKSLYEFTGMI